MDIKELRTTYGEPYNNAYYEIKILLRKYDFYNTQGSVYLTDKDDMAHLDFFLLLSSRPSGVSGEISPSANA
jgi:virulence-associated protein VapD